MQRRLSIESVGTLLDDYRYIKTSVWVTFAEIYNEHIYDLLISDQSHNRSRPVLSLGMNNDGCTYIKNLTNISVSSALEAYELLQIGMHNLKYASTALNKNSSRSHCIFTIKLVQYDVNSTNVQVSYFNFCDLAGSERIKKSCSSGERLKETTLINTSLYILGKCIKALREKNISGSCIPYRESKLTRLFQRALSGYENVAMIVNINPDKNVFEETQHVLNFSAIAKTVEITKKEIGRKFKTRFSDYFELKRQNSPSFNSSGACSTIDKLNEQVRVFIH